MLKKAIYKGVEINYSRKGNSKRTLVLLHGFLENHKVWDDYAKVLAKHNTVYAIDLPGHGQSDCLGYVHSMDEMAGCVKQVLLDNNKRKVSCTCFGTHTRAVAEAVVTWMVMVQTNALCGNWGKDLGESRYAPWLAYE